MYNIFELPHDFLDREYTPGEKKHFDSVIAAHCGSALNEDLTDEQKAKVDDWDTDYKVAREHNEVFGGGGKTRITEPFQKPTKKLTSSDLTNIRSNGGVNADVHHRVVNNHLDDNGYQVTDYAAGHVKKTHDVTKNASGETVSTPVEDKRTYNIGKVLSATGGDAKKTGIMTKPKYAYDVAKGTHIKDASGNKIVTEHPKQLSVSQAYAADPLRAASKGEANIHYTRDKYDVAGSATDRGWKSCVNMDGGGNAHYLKHDIHTGTVSAYLTKKDDNGISSPIARINLKRHDPVGGDSSAKAIYRPEGVYGTAHPDFHNQVSKWAEKTWPMHPSVLGYSKAKSVYNDDGKSIIHNPAASTSHLSNENAHNVIQGHIYDSLVDARNAHEINGDEHGWESHVPDHHTAREVFKFLHSDNDKANHAFHAVHTLESKLYGNSDHDEHFGHGDEGDDVDNARNLHLHEAARRIDAKNLSDDQLVHHLRTYNTKFGDKDGDHVDEDLYRASRKAHNELMNHVLSKPSLSHVHEEILHHFADNPEYHGQIHQSHHHHPFLDGRYDAMQMTKNPRIIHKLLDNSDNWHKQNLAHAGMYADEKLAHHIAHHEHSDEDNHAYFAKGLNHNENGEKIQHSLTSGIYFTGGKSKFGDLEEPVSYTPTGNKSGDHWNHKKAKEQAIDVASGKDHYLRVPGTNDETHNSIFNAIADNSAHHSVLHKLATRSDIHPDTQELAKDQMKRISKSVNESVVAKKTKTLTQIRNGK